VAEVGENVTAGRDYCGPSDLRSNDAWEMNGVILTPGEPQATSNGATIDMIGFEAVTLDLRRMDLDSFQRLTLTVTGDGEAAVTLRGPWRTREVEVRRDGVPIGRVRVVGTTVTIEDDFLGHHVYEVIP
jgi:hypothetical protein